MYFIDFLPIKELNIWSHKKMPPTIEVDDIFVDYL